MLLAIHKFLHKLCGGGSKPWVGRYSVTVQPFGVSEIQSYGPMQTVKAAEAFVMQFRTQTEPGRKIGGSKFTVATYKQPFGGIPILVKNEIM